MTNEQIILNDRFELMKSGKIGTTGKFIFIEDEEGNKKKVKEPAQLHTFFAWKKKLFVLCTSIDVKNICPRSKSFLVIIFVGIGGALLFKKSKTPEAVEFTFSIKDCDDLF